VWKGELGHGAPKRWGEGGAAFPGLNSSCRKNKTGGGRGNVGGMGGFGGGGGGGVGGGGGRGWGGNYGDVRILGKIGTGSKNSNRPKHEHGGIMVSNTRIPRCRHRGGGKGQRKHWGGIVT